MDEDLDLDDGEIPFFTTSGSRESSPDSEDFMQGVKDVCYKEHKEGHAGVPTCPIPISSPTELNPGDHILFQTENTNPPLRPSFQSALVTGVEKTDVKIISYTRCGIYEDDVAFDALKRLHKVVYTSCRYSLMKSVSRARWRAKAGEDHYHTLYNNSHYFVTWAKTGTEYLLYNVVDSLLFEEGTQYPLNPVLTHSTITTLTDIQPGDHLIISSQHYLAISLDASKNTFKAYTTQSGRVVQEEKSFHEDLKIIRMDYDQNSNTYHPGMALESAATELERKEKWEASDRFVTMMKCGRKHFLSPKCILRGDLEPVGCTSVTPHVSVDAGDHLIVRTTFGDYHSVLVYNCINERIVVSIPSIAPRDSTPSLLSSITRQSSMGSLNLLNYNEVYRVNYPQSLPIEEILRRCRSPEAEQMLAEEGFDASKFVSWAKIGKQLSINATKLIGKEQLAQIRPSEYEKILLPDDIEVGDHLFMPNLAYRWHFLVTERIQHDKQGPPVFSTIYCLRGSIKESPEKIDPSRDDVFKILYPEEFPPSLAISRARSLLGEINLSPTARMWFVRWAKTGSDEGLEIDFLKRKTLPVAKSRIVCFTQLDPGDYLVQDKGKLSVRRHYLVASIESATTCTVISAWKGRVQESQLTLDNSTYHRIIHEEGVCLPPEKSILRARQAMTTIFGPKLFRRKFVNYMKTTDSVDVEVESLPEDRLLLQRERVEVGGFGSVDLRPGDHLEMPHKTFQGLSYQDMLVTSVPKARKVTVIRFAAQDRGKQRLVETELDLSEEVELYRVKYLEQVNTEEGIEIVRRSLDVLATKDNAHIMMLATVGHDISLQVDPHLHQVLQCRKEDQHRPPSAATVRQISIEAGARASVHVAFKLGGRVLLHGTRLGGVVGFGPGISILAEAPLFTRRLYKLNRQRKFDRISEEEYKRGVIRQSFTSANTIVGATAGAIVGQLVIPVPVLGAAVGGALGTISGNSLGRLEGWAASKLVQDVRPPTLPVVVVVDFMDYPET